MKKEKEKKPFKFPIGVKTSIIITVFGLIVVEVAMVFFSLVSARTNRENYFNNASNLSATVSKTIDIPTFNYLKGEVKPLVDNSSTHPTSDEWGSEEWEIYMAQFAYITETSEFTAMHTFLANVASSNSDVSSVYVSYVDTTNKLCVYLCDSPTPEEMCPPGCLDTLYEVNYDVLTNPKRGFPPYITNTAEYGYLVTAGTPIMDGDEVVGYAFVDVSMNLIRSKQADNIVRLFLYLLATVVGLIVIGVIIIHFILVKPLKRITYTADSYSSDDSESTHQRFNDLGVNTHDELVVLANSLKKMENDVHEKINELTNKNRELIEAQEETKKMSLLANKDALTGVKNKIAYDNAVEELDKEIKVNKETKFGLVMIDLNDLKLINDEFGHDSGNISLIKLAKLICDSFKHSIVYRVGGDEFVAILKDEDFKNSSKIIEDFRKKIYEISKDEGLSFPERISAAIGYAEYDKKNDYSVDDTFKRADKNMYLNKHEMKTNCR